MNVLSLLRLCDGREIAYCDEYVCLSARITRKPHGRTSPIVLCTLPMALAQSLGLSGGFAIGGLYFPLCGWHHISRNGHSITAASPTKFCSTTKITYKYSQWFAYRGEVCYLWLSCLHLLLYVDLISPIWRQYAIKWLHILFLLKLKTSWRRPLSRLTAIIKSRLSLAVLYLCANEEKCIARYCFVYFP